MNWADWGIVVILIASCLISLKRGFVREALSLANWVLAFIIAMTFHQHLALLFVESVETPSIRQMLAFGLLFAATLIVGAMVNYLIGEVVRMTGLSGTDRLFGMIFGLARGVIVVVALLLLLPSMVPVNQDVWWHESLLIPQFLQLEDWSREMGAELSRLILGLFS